MCGSQCGRLALAIAIDVAPGFPVLRAILPGFHRTAISPQSAMMLAGVAFGCGEFRDPFVTGVVPAEAFANLLQINVTIADVHVAAGAPFGIRLDLREADVLVID